MRMQSKGGRSQPAGPTGHDRAYGLYYHCSETVSSQGPQGPGRGVSQLITWRAAKAVPGLPRPLLRAGSAGWECGWCSASSAAAEKVVLESTLGVWGPLEGLTVLPANGDGQKR